MSQSKLFDYNSSFAITRTNPKLTGNVKISVDSDGGVWLNSMGANPVLSEDRFKKYNVTGQNSFASDVSKFFDDGNLSKDIIFEVGKFTSGESQSAQNFSDEYDFYYASGAQVLVDKNYPEDFSYFAPIWIKNEIPDFFVIFKVPDPIAYPYSKNVTEISPKVRYKVIQDYNSEKDFVVGYGRDTTGNPITYKDGDIFTGNSTTNTYSIISGTGKVAVFSELENLDLANDVETLFKNKILPNATAIKTFDLRQNTKIGKYIRDIFNNPQFSKSPIDVSWGYNSYTYFNGVGVSEGVYTKKGELLNSFLTSSSSDPMMDLEEYITSGFWRNNIICPNLLNLEFYFDDPESDLYTINRYFGMYVSRNDLAQIRMNGQFYYEYSEYSWNENTPIPARNDVGYYYNNSSFTVGATSGIRLFYENGTGFLPGSYNVNVSDSNKLFYITDKDENFYSLKREETYTTYGGTGPEYTYGPFVYSSGPTGPTGYSILPGIDGYFSSVGLTGATSGTIVIQNTNLDILSFTGISDKLYSVKGTKPSQPGRAYGEIEFLRNYDRDIPLTIKFYWPNGTISEGSRKYDLLKSGDFSSIIAWTDGSYYSIGDSHYFNASTGTTEQIAQALSSLFGDVDETTIDSGYDSSSTVVRVKNTGTGGNKSYAICVFDDYNSFKSKFKGIWDNKSAYSLGDIVVYNNVYYTPKTPIPVPSGHSVSPDQSSSWKEYVTFNLSNYIKINGIDASGLTKNVEFIGGTSTNINRVVFSNQYSDQVKPGYYIKTDSGYSKISYVNKFVDSPKKDPITEKVIGFNNFSYNLVAVTEDLHYPVTITNDNVFNVHNSATSNIGVFTFFDVKEFDFDFWSSSYGYTPLSETYRYFQLQPFVEGVIHPNIPYIVKSGQANYNGVVYNEGSLFYGATGYTSFTVSDPSLLRTGTNTSTSNVVVFPAQYSDITFAGPTASYSNVNYEKDLKGFNGFLGIQDIIPTPKSLTPTKEEVFKYGKLKTEYEYLRENYTNSRANKSRIVPYINKWGSSLGVDSRGNKYRLNSSPAFSPTNFSPSFDRSSQDPKYLTHEFFLLQEPPIDFPKSSMNEQKNYLAGKINLIKAKSADPSDSLYLDSYFTVEPEDYPSGYSNTSYFTKELFTPFVYSKASGFYETVFRGVKIVLKRRSGVESATLSGLDRYVSNYRGYEDYKFAAILRPVPEDSTTIQSPVKYQVIENNEQKFILFVCDIVVKDQKVFELGYTGGTGGNPIIDYTLLYTLNDKEKSVIPFQGLTGSKFSLIDDIKLSSGLDLSLASGSFVNTSVSPGRINITPNSSYDTDLREEVHVVFVENSPGATSGSSAGSTGPGSFYAPSISCTYPFPIGVGPKYLEFGKIATGSNYTLGIPFSVANPSIAPVGPSSIYKGVPVFQKEGGRNYFSDLLSRCSLSYISDKFNRSSPYINYSSYTWDSENEITVESNDSFELFFERPTRITKTKGTLPIPSYEGPQIIKGAKIETGYVLSQGMDQYPSILTRYSGPYEPLFRKIFHYDKHKTDTVYGSGIDLSFRNCNFAPQREYFGISKNLSYTKVSLGSPILSAANQFTAGPTYPLIGLTPIAIKDFNVFSSSWDPGYYDRYSDATTRIPVAGTRSMKEYKTFFGSKMMQTPDPVTINNYITLEISRTTGSTSVSTINGNINNSIKPIQSITKSNSGTGIGSIGPYLSGVDFDKLDLNIFPNAELIWQYFPSQNKIKGIIRLDRMLRRYLLNSGIKQVFIDNMISEFGVGDPNSLDDDVNTYIDLNISPIYQGDTFSLYSKKVANENISSSEVVRGDIFTSDRYKMEYFVNQNYKLVKKDNLVFDFEYNIDSGFNCSVMFNFIIRKI